MVIIGAPFDGAAPRTGPAPGSARRPCGRPATPPRDGPARAWRCAWTGCATCASTTPARGDVLRRHPSARSARWRRPCTPSPPYRCDPGRARRRPHDRLAGRHRRGPASRLGRVSLVHFDAHADTGDVEFGLAARGTASRCAGWIELRRGTRATGSLQIGLRGYWPGPETLDWMAAQGMRSYEMTEIVARGLDECLSEAFTIATDECDGVFLSVGTWMWSTPAWRPGTGTPEPGGLTARQLLDAVRRCCYGSCPSWPGVDVVEVSPPVRPRRDHRVPGQPGDPGGALRHRPAPPRRPLEPPGNPS